MSGGSYEYLCYKDAGSIRTATEHLQSMADRLAGLGYAQDAAKETAGLLLLLRQQEVWVQAYIDRLQTIWRAVEWCDSGDSGEDWIHDALKDYRGVA